ncbi:DUF1499 domain-containing protein [Albidovulum sediminicola]|uniref:DUF1499 domain-containing protein n=1 Tax=Albidovulum sediminicola TaxID=2984331 RepID=A0ABT2YZG8_9RHOB|nr:DUF1499 domain-containing protein [Defluviimonas sp. WL0075]MCV2864279.1 DUF1499 domain-containing protein [Defluviimonas sp. WL0075]
MRAALLLVVALLAGGMAYVRLAPSDPARWHIDPVGTDTPAGRVLAVPGGARAVVRFANTTPATLLGQLDAIALSAPRTRRLAGSAAEGRITWVTRSALFGFPDYTTAAARAEGAATRLDLFARQRFGRNDLGVNAARLLEWLARLAP